MEKGTFRSLANTKILDKDNQLIGEVDSGTYLYEDISSIPLTLQNAYIAAEDQNFKTHRGVDYKAILRAGVALVKNKGEITQGGSTITQQVIKNNLLSQEQSFVRKILEILIAPELEKEYSKQELMEFYCNSNYYGNGCYGVGSASRFYFGKDVSELTLAESAMMAGISNSPNNYNPVADFEKATKKKEQILKQMLEQQMITEEEYKLAKEQEIVVTQTSSSLVSADNYMSSYAIHCATLELMELNGFEFDYLFETEEEETNYETSYSDVYKKCPKINLVYETVSIKEKRREELCMHEQHLLYQPGETCCFVCGNFFTCTKNIKNSVLDLKNTCESLVLVTELKGDDPPL